VSTAAKDAPLATVREIAEGMREVHETILADCDIDGTSGTCLYGSYLLQTLLTKFGDCNVRVCGGDGLRDGGAADPSGKWHGHYWVEGVTSTGESFVADVTADQFGWDKVVVLPTHLARDRYRPGDDAIVQSAVADLTAMLDHKYAVCIAEPRGAGGLEGYAQGEQYRFEYRETGASDGKPYYRVWPTPGDYYETCGTTTFLKYFRPIESKSD
jgi:hypothetical protein